VPLGGGRPARGPAGGAAAAADLCSRLGDPLTPQEWSRLAPGVPFMNGCS